LSDQKARRLILRIAVVGVLKFAALQLESWGRVEGSDLLPVVWAWQAGGGCCDRQNLLEDTIRLFIFFGAHCCQS
jgi:hypothetical protein